MTLIDVKEAAAMAGICRRSVYNLVSAGLFPRPKRIGHSRRWVRREIEAWLEADCPPIAPKKSLSTVGAAGRDTQ